MFVYAGIDEAGYGPMFGPLLIGRAVLAVPALPPESAPPHLWSRLSAAVCKDLSRRRGRIAVNDSKKLHTAGAGIKHLEVGVLAFAGLAGLKPATLDQWLDGLGETTHRDLAALPWYAPTADWPWDALPRSCTAGEVAVARAMLGATAKRIGVEVLDLGAAVVFEDRFNRMVAATRSKAAASFTFVAGHLRHVWDRYGEHRPTVVVDRQSGRMHYRELLAQTFPEAAIRILDETPERSAYSLNGECGMADGGWTEGGGGSGVQGSGFGVREDSGDGRESGGQDQVGWVEAASPTVATTPCVKPTIGGGEVVGFARGRALPTLPTTGGADPGSDRTPNPEPRTPIRGRGRGRRAMTVSFEVESESRHMPVALASMLAKYNRELLMGRFQAWFTSRAPQVKPTAGYALDAQRFWREIEPLLPGLAIEPGQLRRRA